MSSYKNRATKNPVPRFRFAPSPTGGLHIGTARTALFNWFAARSMNGKFILRIEDTDIVRSKKSFEDSIKADLGWLGIQWDEFYRQSDRINLYRQYAEKLLRENKAYRCFCTPGRLEELKKLQYSQGKISKYDSRCRDLSEKEINTCMEEKVKFAVRFKVPAGEIAFKDFIRGNIKFNSEVFGDFIVIKSDGTPSYNFAVVIDDMDMNITHVLRGDDHITNTARQIMIFNSLGFKIPDFGHLSMILGSDGAKLSKRVGSRTVREFKDEGYLSEAIGNYLALLSWYPGDGEEIFKISDVTGKFKINDISKSPAVFDIEKLNWINGIHIRSKSNEELLELAAPFLSGISGLNFTRYSGVKYEAGKSEDKESENRKIKLLRCIEAYKEKTRILSEFTGFIKGYFTEEVEHYSPEAEEILNEETSKQVLCSFLEKLENIKYPGTDSDAGDYKSAGDVFFRDFISRFADEMKILNIKGSKFYLPIRSAVTGVVHGPELPKILAILGLKDCILRTEMVISHFYKIGKITKG